jgi:hypothetical protein
MFARVPNSGQGLPASTSSPTTKPASSSTSRCGRPARKWRRSLEARRPASTTRPSQRPGSPHCASKPTKSQRRSEPSPSPSARRPASRATNRYRQTVASSQLLGHSPRDVCRKTGSVMCAGEGTTTGIAPCSCSGASERLPGPTQGSSGRVPLAAHSETVGAGEKMPVRQQRQVSTKVVTRTGYDCFTPQDPAGYRVSTSDRRGTTLTRALIGANFAPARAAVRRLIGARPFVPMAPPRTSRSWRSDVRLLRSS